MECIRVDIERGIARVTLNRPEVRNAFNGTMLKELHHAFTSFDESVRLVVLTGEGKAFCAGADMRWMAESRKLDDADNAQDASLMMDLFRAIDESPRPVIGRINGPTVGGGLGLLACCDIVVSVDTVRFGFTEVKLGVVPAVISPFVMQKMDITAARRYFLTGELFDAHEAKRLGLVHEVVAAPELDATVDQLAETILRVAPGAVAEAKALIRMVKGRPSDEILHEAVKTIARLRVSDEALEGFAAFLEKRKPAWVVE